ncbi:EamA family transporter [Pseudenhygromyxa sp. WMMC2535]|uniref:EamA family transporter n=1 Tax=Pseudenhygromyxa sp. WMMC2535 TaxID=2712867 RepID=UPI001557C669|nr:EamA family transporter [Pseudenhygromyxa sp. WMMC2535]NVB37394.1 EamA family transporter [Pseudenhygromyxa sp. WMMC2535]
MSDSPLSGLGLVLLTASSWAILDAFRKRLSAELRPAALLVLLNAGLLPAFAIWWAARGGTITDMAAYASPGAIAMVLNVAANLLYLAALRASPLSLSIPFLALTPVFSTLVGRLSLGEQLAPVQLVGVALVVLGALTLGLSRSRAEQSPSRDDAPEPARWWSTLLLPFRIFSRERGAWMMTGVAACWGTSAIFDKLALRHAALPVHALIQTVAVIVAGLALLALRGRLRELVALDRRTWGIVGLATLANTLALSTQLMAYRAAVVAMVETIKRAVGLVSAITLGRLIFGEPVDLAKVMAIVTMITGVALLTLGAR